jgi:hypothetical protein
MALWRNLRGKYAKSQGLNGALLRLENRYLSRLLRVYPANTLRITFSDKYRWLNFTRFLGLHNPVDKASLALFIARISVPWSETEFVFVIEAYRYRVIWGQESVSDSISAIEASACGTVYALHWWPFTTWTIIPLGSYWGHGQEFHFN